ncbi:MAG: monovalent cation/H(+) antiporter subunit G [Alphaproteobacteria bacterium]|nr:monovalent cation/H(+) antiporter subunit G [Alphaproteobacteria bacterium]OJV13880.1 MAG: hypothetical protein BGO27_08295 [Alphaproteobacteria bacterium 33-17]
MIISLIAYILIIIGSLICLLGSIGVIRFPDFFTRLHAAGVIDSFGVVLIMIGLAILSPLVPALKILMIAFFIFLTAPTNTHSLANSAFLYKKQSAEPKL